jgi:catechol 2,3-dioxygenase-like lactoylglutathione lyase family enzyme
MAPTLHQTFLMVSDVDRSTEFYRDALGLAVADRGDRSAAFETGEAELMIEQDFSEEELAAFGLEPPGDDRGDGVIVVIEVDDVEAVHERAAAAGADVVMEPTEVNWGREMFLVRDPDGYVLEVSRPV